MVKKHILVVDDSPHLAKEMHSVLTGPHGGYEVTIAEDGYKAFLLCKENTYDLVVTDINMPKFDGFELIMRLRKLESYLTIPIIVASTRLAKEDRLFAKDLGVQVWLIKPIEAEPFLKTVRELLNR